jgi:putative nucleotidyltransferase with HDIG domain
MKKPNNGMDSNLFRKLFSALQSRIEPVLIVTVLAFAVSVLAIVRGRGSVGASPNIQEFEVGRVAERDVIAEQSISYTDEEATRLRLEAEERLVPAVFTFNFTANAEMQRSWEQFSVLSKRHFENSSFDAYRLAVQANFPGGFSRDVLETLFRDPARDRLLEAGFITLKHLQETGIFALPESGLELYNPDQVELLHNYGPRSEREFIAYGRLLTLETAPSAVRRFAEGGNFPSSFREIAPDLLKPFITENVFFSPESTSQRLAEARSHVDPVIREIRRGDRIIKKGFLITSEDMTRLRALNVSRSGWDPRVFGQILILFLVYSFLIYLSGRRHVGRSLSRSEVYLLAVLAVAYLVGAVLVSRLSFENLYLPVSLFLPTALVVMLPAILIGSRVALVMALLLPLSAFLTDFFDIPAYIFALASGIGSAFILHGAEKRMDLVKAGLVIAGVNCAAGVGVLLIQRCSLGEYPFLLFWAAFNGVASGMMVLGCLPLLEHALNAATPFRLIELADLNSPILRRLFITAPGTYSHSIMVANLAESACQEIGANALLARVGAYYHDIGKMDQPDYFVENQTVYNKHNDIAPRLSATVIRSHVKLGVEKGRSLALPQEIIDIIAEHHGNSVISWFYHEALKRENHVDIEDFTYPGNPPRSRESAVIMLADVTEAAVRTLKKPTAARIEKFIQELIMSKFEQDQLSESELTFRDLEAIKKSFVRVLAGHYHSRIEYPKAKEAVSP